MNDSRKRKPNSRSNPNSKHRLCPDRDAWGFSEGCFLKGLYKNAPMRKIKRAECYMHPALVNSIRKVKVFIQLVMWIIGRKREIL
jgi:hypothetical protein